MKIKGWIYKIFVVLFVCSCNEEKIVIDDDSIMTRALVDISNASISNPNLLDNWENIEEIVLNTLGTTTTSNAVTAPWANGASSPLSETFRKDIKKEDGWKMTIINP